MAEYSWSAVLWLDITLGETGSGSQGSLTLFPALPKTWCSNETNSQACLKGA